MSIGFISAVVFLLLLGAFVTGWYLNDWLTAEEDSIVLGIQLGCCTLYSVVKERISLTRIRYRVDYITEGFSVWNRIHDLETFKTVEEAKVAIIKRVDTDNLDLNVFTSLGQYYLTLKDGRVTLWEPGVVDINIFASDVKVGAVLSYQVARFFELFQKGSVAEDNTLLVNPFS